MYLLPRVRITVEIGGVKTCNADPLRSCSQCEVRFHAAVPQHNIGFPRQRDLTQQEAERMCEWPLHEDLQYCSSGTRVYTRPIL